MVKTEERIEKYRKPSEICNQDDNHMQASEVKHSVFTPYSMTNIASKQDLAASM